MTSVNKQLTDLAAEIKKAGGDLAKTLEELDANDPTALIKFQEEYGKHQAQLSFLSKLTSSEITQLKEIIRNFP